MIKLLLPLFFITPVFAYLDPGTGSMLVYFLMGVFATLLYSIKGLFYKVKAFITGGKVDKGLRDLEGIDVLFYSEGGNYWNLFLPVIEEFEKRGIKSAYYTSKENDPALNSEFKLLKKAFIGDDLNAFTLLNNIEVKVVVMTTPQLDVMHLKRSKKVQHYSHLIHAPTDALIYKKFAFDYFDSVMCSGEHQIESIKELEEKRELPSKELLRTGLTYYDVMYRDRGKYLKKEEETTILIAPTWGSNGMLTKFGIEPVEKLLKANYKVILRPHPQMYISQKELMDKLEKQLSPYTTLEIDRNPSGEISMGRADLMISDVSGIIFDFFFIYEKPVVIIEDTIEKGGLEAEDVKKEIWEAEIFDEVATLVNHKNIDTLSDVVDSVLKEDTKSKVEELRNKSLFNFGNSGKVAADQILEMVKD
ncbi:MAG: CDP-glycerol glycerophosphotransferase family protein [Campylobacterales bacterium]|nr:CDP-glycerol glycerophosphotransferase family protein [Campylobacterales bacterium]